MDLPNATPAARGRTTAVRHHRCGALIVEAVMALVLLATATVALAKLARSSAALVRQSDQRLIATLAAENTIQRLRGVATVDLADQADSVAKLVAQDAGCQISVTTEPFTTGQHRGIHVQVDASFSNSVGISLHDWRFASRDDGQADEATSDTPTEGGTDA